MGNALGKWEAATRRALSVGVLQVLPVIEGEVLCQRGDVLKEGVAARKRGTEQRTAFVLTLQYRVKQECQDVKRQKGL